MLDHDLQPLLEVLLHAHSASLEQVLDALDLRLQVFQLRVLLLVTLLELVDPLLDLVFLLSAHQLSIVVDHASQRILLSDLLHLIRQVFDSLPRLVHISSQLLTARVLVLQKRSVLLHSLVLAVALSKHVKGFRTIGQVLQTALDRPVYQCLRLLQGSIKPSVHLVVPMSCCSLLIQLEINALLFD